MLLAGSTETGQVYEQPVCFVSPDDKTQTYELRRIEIRLHKATQDGALGVLRGASGVQRSGLGSEGNRNRSMRSVRGAAPFEITS